MCKCNRDMNKNLLGHRENRPSLSHGVWKYRKDEAVGEELIEILASTKKQ